MILACISHSIPSKGRVRDYFLETQCISNHNEISLPRHVDCPCWSVPVSSMTLFNRSWPELKNLWHANILFISLLEYSFTYTSPPNATFLEVGVPLFATKALLLILIWNCRIVQLFCLITVINSFSKFNNNLCAFIIWDNHSCLHKYLLTVMFPNMYRLQTWKWNFQLS